MKNGRDYDSGRIIRERRESMLLTQEEVAAEIGIEPRTYQQYEYGDFVLANSTMKVGLRICMVLELNPFEMVFETGEDVAGVERKRRDEKRKE